MLRMRKELPEIGHGSYSILPAPPHVLAMCYMLDGKTSVFVHNFLEQRIDFRVDALPGERADRPLVCLQTNEHFSLNGEGCYELVLEPSGYRWFRLGGLEDMIAGEEPEADAPGRGA
jgi:maltose alpha-D-glucosyltransferase/alpha-amylase